MRFYLESICPSICVQALFRQYLLNSYTFCNKTWCDGAPLWFKDFNVVFIDFHFLVYVVFFCLFIFSRRLDLSLTANSWQLFSVMNIYKKKLMLHEDFECYVSGHFEDLNPVCLYILYLLLHWAILLPSLWCIITG